MIGTRLGPYEITAKLGEGGMGLVFRAKDFQLGREVALKVLPEGFTQDPERLARFEREAKLLAQLNHPNIAQVHGLEVQGDIRALVMELVEGPTLSERLEGGPLPFDESLSISLQIAQALEEAHEKGIVHRDMKPQNVKAPTEGKVKVLDFGLAKAMDPAGVASEAASASQLAQSPTLSLGATQLGVILGSAAYMSPEQAKGLAVDKRADIWAFGVVFWEMLTGRRLFDAPTVQETLAQVLTREPDLDALPATTPAAIRRLVRRCLDRNPKNRLHDIADARIVLEEVASGRLVEGAVVGPTAPPVVTRSERWRRALPWAVAVGALVAAAWALSRGGPPAAPARPVRFGVTPGSASLTTFYARISPDGRHVSFTASTAAGRSQIWLRSLDSLATRALPGTEGAGAHFWSPDSRSIGFFAGGHLERVEIDGGMPRILCDAPGSGPFRSGAWSREGTILFRIDEAPGHPEGFFRVAATGGEPTRVKLVDEAGSSALLAWPSFLPDGKHFLVACARPAEGEPIDPRRGGVCLVSLDSGETRELKSGISYAEYVAPGYLAFAEGGSLFVQPFDQDNLLLFGRPTRIAEGMESWGGIGLPVFSFSDQGALVYQGGEARSRLIWKDRSGRELGEVGTSAAYEHVRLAPDGRRAVVELQDPQRGMSELWIVDLPRNVASRVDATGSDVILPVWSPGGERLVYCRAAGAPPFLHTRPLDGGAEEVLVPSNGSLQCPSDWSTDGRFLLFTERHAITKMDIWMLAFGERRETELVLRTAFPEYQARFSPDGRWIAYVSEESGRPEIYLQRFPGPGRRVRVSTDGGSSPRWRRDGRELFYESSDGDVMAVVVELGEDAEVGTPTPLFALGPVDNDVIERFDVSADGQRFLVIALEGDASPAATVVLDWAAQLQRADRSE
ncbi:MAG TPA: protein kinase [Thermoanaerobaculia bacterium]|jgi:Tol biopolymer transport system component